MSPPILHAIGGTETFLANVNQPKSAHNFIVLNFDEVFAFVVQYVSHMNLLFDINRCFEKSEEL